ncbi:MAG: CvpA family protein [Alphaproteobacteria bacterium]|nr:CvpA family protein [Alphaproteobacteria bacterium SS10]
MEAEAANAGGATADLLANIHWVDIAAIATLLLSGLLALFRGFTKEFFQVVNVVVALTAAAAGLPLALPFAEQVLPAGWIANAVTGIVIFIVVAAVMALISGQISKAIRKSSLSTLDRSLGFAFGLVRGMLIVCLAYIVLLLISNPKSVEATLGEARSGNLILLGANTIIQLLPEETVAAIGLDEALEPAKESAGPKPALDEVRPVAEPNQADGAGSANDSDARSASDDILEEGYKALERQAIEALLDAAQDAGSGSNNSGPSND